MSESASDTATDAPSSTTPATPEVSHNEEKKASDELSSTSSAVAAESATESAASQYGSDYEKFISYDENGTAIYTDPSTQYKYKFSKEENQWQPLDEATAAALATATTTSTTTASAYENEHYRWCHKTNRWIPKDGITETEFYSWDGDRQQWIPKTASQGEVVTEFKDGVHTYTDKDGVDFFWDTEKNAWFPKIDDNFMAMYQMSYGFVDNTSTPSTETDQPKSPTTIELPKGGKRKAQEPRKLHSNDQFVIVRCTYNSLISCCYFRMV